MVAFVFLLGAWNCGGGPTGPTPEARLPAPVLVTVTGRAIATNGMQPLPGLAVSVTTGQTAATDANGMFAIELPGDGGTRQLKLEGPSIVERVVFLGSPTAREISVDAIALTAGFDLEYYRRLVRRPPSQPEQLLPLRRWTRAPMIYLRTVDEAGQAIDTITLETVANALSSGVAESFTGGRFGIAGIERGTETREGMSGWITVKWPNPMITDPPQCGTAQVGVEGGWIQLNYLNENCGRRGSGCNQSRIRESTVRHELGHALGFYHTGDATDLMSGLGDSDCRKQASTRERLHASVAYSRPIGNTDPDTDGAGSTTLSRVDPNVIVVVD